MNNWQKIRYWYWMAGLIMGIFTFPITLHFIEKHVDKTIVRPFKMTQL